MSILRAYKENRFRRSFKKNGIWFVDIPRTGSTSIKTVLANRFGVDYGKSYNRKEGGLKETMFPDHTEAVRVAGFVGSRLWSKAYSFAFVRNPWERFYSLYQYRIANGDFGESFSFREYVLALRTPRFGRVKSPFCNHAYHLCMCDYIEDGNGDLMVDDVFRFEAREQALAALLERTGIDFSGVWRESTRKGEDFREMYDDEMSELVGDFYAADVERFGYRF